MSDWQVILKNSSGADVLISDMGLTVLNGGTEEVSLQAGYSEIANSEDLKTLVTAGTLVINDGSADLSVTDGLAYIRRANKKYVDDQISNIDISAVTDPIQTELDAVEATIGAMSATDGTFVAPTGTNYINGATSVTDAAILLDYKVKSNEDNITQNASDIVSNAATSAAANQNTQAELDTVEVGAGLNADGTYTANTSSNYISGATSLKDADNALDAQIKANADAISAIGTGSIAALQAELDTTQTGAGLNADGTYTADSTTNYITSATSLKNADKLLDTQVKTNADAVAINASDISTNAGNIAQNTSDISTNAGNISNNATAISNEITARTNADTAIQAELDVTQTGAGLNADGTYTADAATNYIASATDLANADSLLDAQIKTNADGVAQEIIDRATADALKVNKAGDSMSGTLDMGGNTITGLAAPVSGTDAVNKTYADTTASGFAPKAPVVVATTVSITLSGLQTIDGITLVAGDRVLVKDQTSAVENGAYDVIDSASWTRTTDFDGTPANEVQAGARFYVRQGTANAGAAFTLLGSVGQQFVPGTDALTFGQTAGEASTANIQDELDTVELSSGLNTDGTYTADSGANYIAGATSLKGADTLLDAQIKVNADAITNNSANITTNTSDISAIDTRTTALEDKSANFGVINGIVVGKDTVRAKWLGFRQSATFAVNGQAKNRYLHIAGVPSNLSSTPMAENMTITSLAVQLKSVTGADATINILKNSSPVVLGSLVISAGNAGANVNTLDIDLTVGDYIQLQVSSTQAISHPVATLTAAFNGGSV